MTSKPTIVVDTYGGVEAPKQALSAAARLSLTGRMRLCAVGHLPTLQRALSDLSYDPSSLRLVDGGVTHPRQRADHLSLERTLSESLAVCLGLLARGEADAMLTAAPAQSVWRAAKRQLAPLSEDLSPALAAVVPTLPRGVTDDPFALLLDVSGDGQADAEDLVAWAVMGSTYARVVSGNRKPQVALLSTGSGREQGPQRVQLAHERLQKSPGLQFVGSLQAVEIPSGYADVVVCDGFTGHAVRGVLEGVTKLTVDAARYAWRSKVAWRAGLTLLSQGVGMLRRVNEFRQYGGAPMLGLEGLILVADSDSSDQALDNGLRLAAKCVERDLMGQLQRDLQKARSLSE